jgi:hypothetical protein
MTRTPLIHLIAAGLFLLAAIAAYAFWYRHVNALSSEAAELSAQLQTLGDAGGRASSVRRDLEEVGRQEADVYRRFVGTDTIVTYLEAVEATGRGLGAKVTVVSVADAPARAGHPPELQMAFQITGSFDAVMRTLGAIEYQAYDTTLSNVTLDTPTGDNWTAAANFLIGTTPPKP